MFEQLDTIDWKTIKSGFGSSERIPQLIRDLTSPSEATRSKAMRALNDHIYRQGDVYEATPLVVACLLELLADEHIACKDEIMWELQLFADPPDEDAPEPPRADEVFYQSAFEMIVAALDSYLDLMNHAVARVRRAAVNMVWRPIYPPNRLLDIAQALVSFIEHERDAESRAFALLMFRRFVEWQRDSLQAWLESYARLLEVIWRSGAEPPIPQAAAIALAAVVQKDALQAVDAYLADLAAYQPLEGVVSYVEAVSSIWQLGQARGVRALIQALNNAPDDVRARKLAGCLLAGVFENNPLRRPDGRLTQDRAGQAFYDYRAATVKHAVGELTEHQRQAVRAVLENDQVWRIPHNLLVAFGLPSDRDAVRRRLG